MPEQNLVSFDANGKNDRVEYAKFLETELKELKVPEEEIKKAIETIGKVAKPFAVTPPQVTPPEPLPAEVAELVAYAKGKDFNEALKAFVTEKKIISNAAPNNEELTRVKSELETTKQLYNQRLQADNDAVAEEIKGMDKEFDAKKFLQGVTDMATQKTMLENLCVQLKKKVKPLNLQLSAEEAKTKVDAVAKGMFGDANVTVESIIGIKKP